MVTRSPLNVINNMIPCVCLLYILYGKLTNGLRYIAVRQSRLVNTLSRHSPRLVFLLSDIDFGFRFVLKNVPFQCKTSYDKNVYNNNVTLSAKTSLMLEVHIRLVFAERVTSYFGCFGHGQPSSGFFLIIKVFCPPSFNFTITALGLSP